MRPKYQNHLTKKKKCSCQRSLNINCLAVVACSIALAAFNTLAPPRVHVSAFLPPLAANNNFVNKIIMASSADDNTENTMELINSRLSSMNLKIPKPGTPRANYQFIHRDGNTLHLSGHLPMRDDGSLVIGICAPPHIIEKSSGEEESSPVTKLINTQEGYEGGQHCALNLLSTLNQYLDGDLSKITKIVKLFGLVRSHTEFTEQHLVVNGASDTFCGVLGKEVGGCHARSAVGTNALPFGICVEVECIVKIRDD